MRRFHDAGLSTRTVPPSPFDSREAENSIRIMETIMTPTTPGAPRAAVTIRPAYLSQLILDLFAVAKQHISKEDLSSIAVGIESGCASLECLARLTEKIGCTISENNRNGQGWFNMDDVPDLLFLLGDQMDACLAQIAVGYEASDIANN
jgi:hypothetical protein